MNTNSIGIFDSGCGGLTAMRRIQALLPHENIIYFGDTARLPYGNKSRETIQNYCFENISFLIEKQIKVLVIACHTACTAALDPMRKRFDLPILGIVEQGIEEAVEKTRTKKIAIAGTRATISSGAYQEQLKTRLPDAEIVAIACPLFVPLVEEGYADHPITSLIIREYLGSLKEKQIDTLLLGCTHYPLLQPLLQKELSTSVALVDPAFRCAESLREFLIQKDLLHPQQDRGRCTFYVSDDPEKFRLLGQTFLNHPIEDIFCL